MTQQQQAAWPFPGQEQTHVVFEQAPAAGTPLNLGPHASRARTRALPAANCNVLALDLGTYCGWAIATKDGAVSYGTEHFIQRNKWHPGVRWSNYRAWLAELIRDKQITAVYFEDVKRHAGTLAAHVYGGYLAMTEMVCQQHNIPMVGIGVGQAKKKWTGSGRADKTVMVKEAQRRGFKVASGEDDTADALALLAYALEQEQ